jgi:LPS sulfotransferase NodH
MLAWKPDQDVQPMTEANQPSPVMPAAEVQMLVGDLCAELVPSSGDGERVGPFMVLMEGFVQDWRQLCGLHGTSGQGEAEFRKLASGVHDAARTLAGGLVMRTNGVGALHVLEARVLKHLLVSGGQSAGQGDRLLETPVFIVAAPRSGSTLLFDTLACSPGFNTFGGEAHWLIEGLEQLRPGAPGVDSNRLMAVQATAGIIALIRQAAVAKLQGYQGRAPTTGARMLEKTPKNSLRIPFLKQVFPDARFIFLWRDPRDNLNSIMEAWRSGNWVTYPAVPGWDGPWSLLLPPGWQALRGAPLEAVAARQWLTANEIALDDLQELPRQDWTAVSFHDLVGDPAATVRRLCEFAGVEFDAALQARTANAALPQSRSTHTAPAPDKWLKNKPAIERVLPDLQSCWQRLRALR